MFFVIKNELCIIQLTWFRIWFSAITKPEVKPFQFSGVLKTGRRTSVICAVTHGDPPFVFEWFKDGRDVSLTKGVVIRNIDDYTSNLVITSLDGEHNGNYTCRVSNSAGIDQHFEMLLMKSKFFF